MTSIVECVTFTCVTSCNILLECQYFEPPCVEQMSKINVSGFLRHFLRLSSGGTRADSTNSSAGKGLMNPWMHPSVPPLHRDRKKGRMQEGRDPVGYKNRCLFYADVSLFPPPPYPFTPFSPSLVNFPAYKRLMKL